MGDGIARVYDLDSCMSDKLLAFATGITAIDAVIPMIEMDPELIIGSRDTAKSAIAIDVIIIDQPA